MIKPTDTPSPAPENVGQMDKLECGHGKWSTKFDCITCLQFIVKALNSRLADSVQSHSVKDTKIAELEATIKLQWDANQRGIKMWQAENPTERELTWPDQAHLVKWLIDRATPPVRGGAEPPRVQTRVRPVRPITEEPDVIAEMATGVEPSAEPDEMRNYDYEPFLRKVEAGAGAEPREFEKWEVGQWFVLDSPECTHRYSVQRRTSGGCSIVCSSPYVHDGVKRDMEEIAASHNAKLATPPVRGGAEPRVEVCFKCLHNMHSDKCHCGCLKGTKYTGVQSNAEPDAKRCP